MRVLNRVRTSVLVTGTIDFTVVVNVSVTVISAEHGDEDSRVLLLVEVDVVVIVFVVVEVERVDCEDFGVPIVVIEPGDVEVVDSEPWLVVSYKVMQETVMTGAAAEAASELVLGLG